MGTTLTGLTPATTYDALIKVGDNGPITGALKVLSDGLGTNLPMEASTTAINFTGTLTQAGTTLQPTLVSGTNIKTINSTSILGSGNIAVVTSPSGVAGAIQFSNGSAFASDASNLFWDDTNNRLGVGTNTPSATGHFQGAGDQLWATNSGDIYTYLKLSANGGLVSMTFGDGNGTVNYLNNYAAGMWASNKFAFGPSLFTPSGQVHIKGGGSTSATTSLLVQNSAGTAAVTIKDDLNATFGGSVTSVGGFGSLAYFDSFQRVALNNGVNTNAQSYLKSLGVGQVLLVDNTEADFNRLQFGGTSSSFPSLKRSTTNLQVRLADDSGYAPIDASLYKVGGTNGFTGTGSYTNFTIVGGIITNAS